MPRLAAGPVPLTVVIAVLTAPITLHAEDWPGWRGPTGMGHTSEKGLPLTWGGQDGANILWKVPLVAEGAKIRFDHNQSSPVVVGDRVFITLSYWPDGKTNREYSEHHVVCFQKSDGKRLWDTRVEPGGWLLSDFRGGGYACSTPAADKERVYVVFGSAVIAALDHQGKLVWRQEIGPKDFDVAIAASPVLYGDTVLLICDKVGGKSSLIAFDRKSGNIKWEEKRPDVGFAHSTPVLTRIGGKTQMLVAASNALQGLDPDTGKVLWKCSAIGDTCSPVLGGTIVFCDSGRGGSATAVDPTGTGDVTRTHLKWTKGVPEGFSSAIAVGDYVYRLHNPGLVTCWKLTTGEEVYKERLQGITSTAASPIATPEGRIYLASAGKSYILQSGPQIKILAVNDLGDACHASPAISNGTIILKGSKFLYCIGEKAPPSPPPSAGAVWEPTTTELLKSEKTGYGGLCGVVVDHATGTVFIDLSDRGLFRSPDQGKTWKATAEKSLKGRTEWPGCLTIDPTARSTRLLSALVYGAPIAVSSDGGKLWSFMNERSSHIDWCAVDWTDPDLKFVLALKHESGDLLIVSRDGGNSFEDVGKGYGPAWVFDTKTAVVAEAKSKANPKPKLLRTDDAAKTFTPCGDYSTKALPKWRGNTLFWVVEGAVIASTDTGKSWKKLGDLKDGRYGPIFGKDQSHMFVLAGAGIVESTDGGATWSKPLELPKEVKGGSPLTWIEYDPTNDTLYAMKMGSQLYKRSRR